MSGSETQPRRTTVAEWKAIVEKYQTPNAWRASWQLIDTLGAYLVIWVLLFFALKISWWLTLPLMLVGGGLLVRTFIIFHDCGHGSFFKSRIANDVWGFISGVLTFTPYYHWRWEHATHHGASGDLDRRGVGDVWTLTVQEYLESSRWKRFAYRLSRNPFVLFVLAPIYLFLLRSRVPAPGADARERESVWWMNLAILVMGIGLIYIFGVIPYLVLQLVILIIAGSAGVWLFYMQHQFEDVYWERGDDWDYTAAALQGSSFYKLPRILQWFSGNIGFHHIHHLSPRIPNYNLERCHQSDPIFRDVKPMTLFSSLKSLGYRLWDESNRKLVTFRAIRSRRRQLTHKQDNQADNPDNHQSA